jgi:hypothetical protein
MKLDYNNMVQIAVRTNKINDRVLTGVFDVDALSVSWKPLVVSTNTSLDFSVTSLLTVLSLQE